MSRRSRMSRRGFLGTGLLAGGAALTAPFWRVLKGQAADGAPKRFIALMTPCGQVHNAWTPRGTEADFTFRRILAPLAPYKSKVVVVDGLDMESAIGGPGGGHQQGCGALLTGRRILDGPFAGQGGETTSGWAAGISVDQEIANRIGGETRFASLELGVRIQGSNNRHRIAYRGANDPLPPEDNPRAVFDRLFGDLGVDPAELERIRQERQSVIDLVAGDIDALNRRLGTEDQRRLDAHLTSIRDLESRLETSADATCTAPELGAPFDHRAEARFPDVSRLQIDNLCAAFACDLTRVATLLYSGATSSQRFPWLGISESHHSLSHEGDSNAAAQEQLTQINEWYAGEVAYLLGRLDSIPEGDGTMLDHTLIFWGNELSKGNTHARRDMKFVLAGSADGAIRTGRYLQFDGRSHNDLLTSFLHAMGMTDIDKFGTRDLCSGPLAGLVT